MLLHMPGAYRGAARTSTNSGARALRRASHGRCNCNARVIRGCGTWPMMGAGESNPEAPELGSRHHPVAARLLRALRRERVAVRPPSRPARAVGRRDLRFVRVAVLPHVSERAVAGDHG